MAHRRWTSQDDAFLFACAQYCFQHDLSLIANTTTMFKRAGKDRTREAIRWRVQQYGPVKQFEEHGISFHDLSPAFEREIAAQTRRILLGSGPAAASETGTAIVRQKIREASLIEAANVSFRMQVSSRSLE